MFATRPLSVAKDHFSLMLLVVFSAFYFLSMIVARKTLDTEDLYFWNALVTLIAICFSFCFLGAEQLFLRYSEMKNGSLYIPIGVMGLMFGALAIFTVLLTIFSEYYFFNLGNFFIYPLMVFCIGLFVFVYNYLRVRTDFCGAQLAANGWKLFVFIALLLGNLGPTRPMILAGLFVAALVALWLLTRSWKYLVITRNPMPYGWKSLFLGFFLSLFVLMVLSSVDRLLIAGQESQDLFSEYVYLVILLLMPFSLLSNYIGFKEVANLKRSYVRKSFINQVYQVTFLSALLYVPWFAILYSLQSFLAVPVYLDYFLPCFLVVTSRCAYALFSTLFGLRGKSSHMHIANLLTICVVVLAIFSLQIFDVSIFNLLCLAAFLWVARLMIYARFTSNISQESEIRAI